MVVIQKPRALLVDGEHPMVVARPMVEPAMTINEQKRLDRFQNLHPLHFDGNACRACLGLS